MRDPADDSERRALRARAVSDALLRWRIP